MRPSDPWLCPLCATPFHLKRELLFNVSRDHITCSPPRIIGQELYSTTEMFPEHQDSLKMESGMFGYFFKQNQVTFGPCAGGLAVRFCDKNFAHKFTLALVVIVITSA